MLVCKSIHKVRNIVHIYDTVKLQSNISIFFKQFYELDFTNMVSILSFN